MTLEKYLGHICRSGSHFAPVNWLAQELQLLFSSSAETSAAGKWHEHGLAQALQHTELHVVLFHVALTITKYPELCRHWDLFTNLSWMLCALNPSCCQYCPLNHFCNSESQAVFGIARAASVYMFPLAIGVTRPFGQQSAVTSSHCWWDWNTTASPASLWGPHRLWRAFLGAEVFLGIYKGPAWSIFTPLLKAPGHSLPCLPPTCTRWLPRALQLLRIL